MGFGVSTNVVLGVLFVAVGLAATVLQLWLWRFPMAPDPSGVDPNGVTTAPRAWRMVHRALGYLFALVYLVLMLQMVPRLWQYDDDSWGVMAVAHAVLGALVGIVLVMKTAVLRRFQRFGKSMRPLGLSIFAMGALAVGIAARPVLVLREPPDPGMRDARQIVLANCAKCHGLGTVLGEGDEGGDWMEVLEEMAEQASKRGLADPSSGRRADVAAYLTWALGERTGRGRERERERGRDRDDD